MKEYIRKEDLIKDIQERAFHGTTIEIIKEQPTVTKADICRDILNEIKIAIQNTGHSDQYTTGFCNALIWLESYIIREEPKYFEPFNLGEKEQKNEY